LKINNIKLNFPQAKTIEGAREVFTPENIDIVVQAVESSKNIIDET
jgi:hypothetical protein